MAKSTAELDIKINGEDSVEQVEQKTKSLKTQLKEMKALLASGTLDNNQFNKLAAEAGELEDRIGDVNQRVRNLASDSKNLDALVDATQGIVGGFAAVQGITALVGTENEDLQKTMVKLQAAMTAVTGIQAVANTLNKDSALLTSLNTAKTAAASTAQYVYSAAVGTSTGAMKAFRIALLATGIGAIVVLLGAATAAMIKLTGATKEQEEALNNLNDEMKVNADFLQNGIEISDHITERELRNAKLRGATEEELNKIKKAGYTRNINDLESALKDQKKLIDNWNVNNYANAKDAQEALNKLTEEYDKINNQLTKTKNTQELADLDAQIKAKEDKEKAAADAKTKKDIADAKNIAIAKAKKEAAQKEFDDLFAQLEKEMELQAQADEEAKKQQLERDKLFFEATANERQLALKAEEDAFNEKMAKTAGDQALMEALTVKHNENLAAINKQFDDADAKAKEEQRQKEIEADKKLLEEKIAIENAKAQIVMDTTNIIGNLGTILAGEQFKQSKLAKALALTQIATDTALAISSLVRMSQANPANAVTGGIAGTAQFIAGIAQITANIAKAKQVLTSGGNVSVSGGAGFNGGNTNENTGNAPNPNLFTTNNNQNPQQPLPPQKVYVLESDISNTQKRIVEIRQNATII